MDVIQFFGAFTLQQDVTALTWLLYSSMRYLAELIRRFLGSTPWLIREKLPGYHLEEMSHVDGRT